MNGDLPDRELGEALDRAVLTIESDPEPGLPRIRRRGSARRWVRTSAIGASLALVLGAVGYATVKLAPGHSIRVAEGPWVTSRDPELGWTFQHPAGWPVTSFHDVCRVGFTGSMVSNVHRAYRSPVSATGCHWPPKVGRLPLSAVVVEFDVMLGGPPPLGAQSSVKGLASARPPFTLDQAMYVAVGGGMSLYTLEVRLKGSSHPYAVRVWIGSEASAADLATAKRVLASIRPSRPPVPLPPGPSPLVVTLVPSPFPSPT